MTQRAQLRKAFDTVSGMSEVEGEALAIERGFRDRQSSGRSNGTQSRGAETGRTNWNTAPLGVFPATHKRPP